MDKATDYLVGSMKDMKPDHLKKFIPLILKHSSCTDVCMQPTNTTTTTGKTKTCFEACYDTCASESSEGDCEACANDTGCMPCFDCMAEKKAATNKTFDFPHIVHDTFNHTEH